MNSPWGIEYNIIKQLRWTRKYVLWGESWVNIRLMMADAPVFKSKPKVTEGKELEDEDDFKEFLKL